mgnify:CR=1 FL=1
MNFFKEMQLNEESYTENGAKGYATTGSYLVDLNFKIPSLRALAQSGEFPYEEFDLAYQENPVYALKWLLFLRDIKQGCGERDSFRKLLIRLADTKPTVAIKFINCFMSADYGRWDDLVDVYFKTTAKDIKQGISKILQIQLKDDLNSEHPSLLAKWLPSESSANKETSRRAKLLAKEVFKCSSKEYRKTLSSLRKLVAKTEVLTSANKWNEIDYNEVPSKANLKYESAFERHDNERRIKYLEDLQAGKSSVKINANSMFLYDIVRDYQNQAGTNPTLEALWEAQERTEGFTNTLVVRDGSGSMGDSLGNNLYPSIIADSLTLYCAENNVGAYKNKFITFSASPQCIELPDDYSLYNKLKLLANYFDWQNTNIEAVFDLILKTAVEGKVSPDEMPESVLIISDMEFDDAFDDANKSDTLFESIHKRFESAGYELPRLIFWNVCSRTNTIPMRENENGLVLISGFSKSLLQVVIGKYTSPYEALIAQLSNPRYECVNNETTEM